MFFVQYFLKIDFKFQLFECLKSDGGQQDGRDGRARLLHLSERNCFRQEVPDPRPAGQPGVDCAAADSQNRP
jgi:hypothetical protein